MVKALAISSQIADRVNLYTRLCLVFEGMRLQTCGNIVCILVILTLQDPSPFLPLSTVKTTAKPEIDWDGHVHFRGPIRLSAMDNYYQ
ncbi:hypothetical protein K437DRAFT_49046 [Tilletiaria anomala UBC 951]|uniref:Uncharacterized protein n=1 Tax=Tilletiaria anomala (strain ATCC 24038 / CBS 436.72 / UBC 951) TaxID=1037660 RepID=A0A066V4T7_TILAU|nr:uncharacterized protein K437DRAFT_49046 [Tilletiaria anomala UBC 951]KDN36742.1 hypothetical protein K437DRAFT_49046 [Tilletiaria anomala UBC 951]